MGSRPSAAAAGVVDAEWTTAAVGGVGVGVGVGSESRRRFFEESGALL